MMTPIQFANYKRVLKALEKMGEKILRISVCPDCSIEISCGDGSVVARPAAPEPPRNLPAIFDVSQVTKIEKAYTVKGLERPKFIRVKGGWSIAP